MSSLSRLSNQELIAMLSAAVRTECAASAEVIAHLAELDRRKLYLDEACSSLFAYCVERLGYSEDSAFRRVRVARAAERWPRIVDELARGAIHLTGLFLLAEHLNDDNADALLDAARGKSKAQIQELLAARSPQAARPACPARVVAVPAVPAAEEQIPLTRASAGSADSPAPARVEPARPVGYRLEVTISAELRDKLERLGNLLSHAVPSGDLAELLERAVDALLEQETKRRAGAGKPRKRRALKPGSRHVPVDVERAVRERDGDQCTFVDAQGRRCCEKRFLTLEHDVPFALGGAPTVENVRLLCMAHNGYTARQVFGDEHVRRKVVSAVGDQVLAALVHMGFERGRARKAVAELGDRVEPRAEPLLRAALAALTPS